MTVLSPEAPRNRHGPSCQSLARAAWIEDRTADLLDSRNENELLVGELSNWRVQKLTLRPGQAK